MSVTRPTTGWVTPEAPSDSELASCVQCGLCLPVCPTYRLTGEEGASPRGRLTAMSAIADGVAPVDDTFEEMMSFCLQCRACEAACPSLVPFGRAMEGARAELTAQRPNRHRRMRHRLLGRRALGSRRSMSAATKAAALGQRIGAHRWMPSPVGRGLAGLRWLPWRSRSIVGSSWPAIGDEVGTAALLSGCVMDPWFGDVHRASIAVLRRAGFRVVVPDGQTCCGALAAHDGAAARAKKMADTNDVAFAGFDLVVTNSAGCGAHMKDHVLAGSDGNVVASPVRDVTEVVAAAIEDGRLPAVGATGRRVAIQDPCHLRHAQRVIEEPRLIVGAAGYEPIDIDPLALCCGAAGVYSLLRPDTSAELGRRKAEQVQAAGVRLVASANPGCEMQLRSYLGRSYRIAHPVEIYAEAIDGARA